MIGCVERTGVITLAELEEAIAEAKMRGLINKDSPILIDHWDETGNGRVTEDVACVSISAYTVTLS